MSDFSETATTEVTTGYDVPIYLKSGNYFGRIYTHDGNIGKMLIVNNAAGNEAIFIIQYPNQFFNSIADSESSDATEFDGKYADVETILDAL